MEDLVELEGAETIAALILEPVGNTGGVIMPPPGYLAELREICDRHDILLIYDEIITGFGRTGNMFAAQTFEAAPDILCMGKGMSSGYVPLAGIAFRDSIAAAFLGKEEDEVEFSHGHTYGGNPLAAAAGLANLAEIRDRDLCARARETGGYVRQRLEDLRELGIVGDIRGCGLLAGVEFVADPETRTPFDPSLKFGVEVGRTALGKGLLTRFDPGWIALAPPLVITREETDRMLDVLSDSIREVVKKIRA